MNDLRDVTCKIIENLQFNNCVLVISHSDYRVAIGGTEKVLHEEQELLSDCNISYVQVYPVNIHNLEWVDPTLQLVGINVDSQPVGIVTASQLNNIIKLIEQAGVRFLAVNIHHLKGIGTKTAEVILGGMNAELRFFLHDYYSICPQFNLLQNDLNYCDGPERNSSTCKGCKYGEERGEHLKSYEEFFNKNEIHFIAPSEVAKSVWGNTYPSLKERVTVYPHQVLTMGTEIKKSITSPEKVKIAYVGYQSDNKGWEAWRSFVTHNSSKEYELFHLGAGSERFPHVKQVDVSFVENGPDAMIDAIKKHEIDVAFLWSIWPETYSFTVFESLAAGCFVVTNTLSGNIAVKAEEFQCGVILKDTQELYNFFSNPLQVKEHVNQARKVMKGFSLKFNPKLAKETSTKIWEKEVPTRNDLLPKETMLMEIEKIRVDEKWLHQISHMVQEINRLTEFIDYLQGKHHEKDMAINGLRHELNKYENDPGYQLSQKWKAILSNYPILRRIVKRGIQRISK